MTVVTVFPCERCAEEEVDIAKEVDVAALTKLFLKEEFLRWIGRVEDKIYTSRSRITVGTQKPLIFAEKKVFFLHVML